jgi:hypothetical protein
LGAVRSRPRLFSFDASAFSKYAARISAMPVASMKAGSLKGGLSRPRLPWR